MIRSYSELRHFETLEERFDYLALAAVVGDATFGFDRWMNQQFYRSREWKQVRDEVIVRDEGFELGVWDTPIVGSPTIHHMNPLTTQDIDEGSDNLCNPEFLITVSHRLHNAIHFGDKRQLPRPFVERRPGDTVDW